MHVGNCSLLYCMFSLKPNKEETEKSHSSLYLNNNPKKERNFQSKADMSLGYAHKLSYTEDVGTVGMSEIFDPPHVLEQKIEMLAEMIQQSKHLVAFTGAGISTSSGIPDFRGPNGVWTLQRDGKAVPEASLPFHRAMPSMTHMALVELEKAGLLKFVISQNVDSLHLRSGLPREKLAELHGNSFREMCPTCGVEYLRDFEVETIGMKKTPRRCSDVNCGARLVDTVLDWEDALPSKEMNPAEQHCRMADVVLCLGSSLQITPACNLPLKCLRDGGKIVIVNLQATPKDKKASLVIHALVDKVIAGLMHRLCLRIPQYVRVDFFQISLVQLFRLPEKKYVKWTLRLESIHGQRAPLAFIKSVEVSFSDRPELKKAVLHQQPFMLKREMLRTRPITIVLKLNFSDGCGCQSATIELPVNFLAPADRVVHDKDVVAEKLRNAAIEHQCCGQISLVERRSLSSPDKGIEVYAIATDIVSYNNSFDDIPRSSGHLAKRQNKCMSSTEMSLKKLKCH